MVVKLVMFDRSIPHPFDDPDIIVPFLYRFNNAKAPTLRTFFTA